MTRKAARNGFELSETRRTLPIALLRARETVMERFRPMLSAHGVTEQQWRVLRVLQEADELDATDVSEAACILAPSISRMTRTLEAKGLVETRKDPADGRRSLIRLTKAGDSFLRQVAPESAAIYEEIETLVGRDRIEALLDEVDALLNALERDG
ncbi:homoprotocatechuate degradation operon regulator HpaR [Maritimibacter sp. DP07]|uniref:Homoprotocatechuate degradation operon regulator HpaR n=1 Tax=Maritimibacter harenae TaxID=2606218 RepID=A0A845MBS7_9RHOB|nr:homoprotocatechuate degradation operon regulator HpaR [Maritimibacter harenae]MZR14921.1 homoprotocatechuate degradation operon regulator HpaR [Maritimibacter harenae]